MIHYFLGNLSTLDILKEFKYSRQTLKNKQKKREDVLI